MLKKKKLATLYRDNPDACISCSICLTACPVVKATQKYRGPKLNGPALTRLRKLTDDYDPMINFCSNCKNCDRVCPSGTPISALNMKARALHFKTNPHPLNDKLLSRNEELGKLMSTTAVGAKLANIGMKVGCSLKLVKMMGLNPQAPFPQYAGASFYKRFKEIKQNGPFKRQVLFYPGCYVNYNEPELGELVVKILNYQGVEVLIDKRLKCCGSPLLSCGYLDKVEDHAKINTAILADYAKRGIDIVTTCTTCSLFLKQEYAELFDMEKEVEAYNQQLFEICEYLLYLDEQGEFKHDGLGPVTQSYVHHTPCHLKVQGMGVPSMKLLSMIPALKVEQLTAPCCGLSGVYGYKEETAAISANIGAELKQQIKEASATAGVCECNLCRLQMQNGTGKKAYHPLYLLDASYKAGHAPGYEVNTSKKAK
ncbi:MAG: anaerobic glycerol-3-phosphate dehydrogenase subunit C [Candidatus Anaerobiospirillum merdipullorum]|uniref:Anaerobic glycerol-3-phosphate dehydrogenase subunit C n=1 Tax=Candidatus Anaerobiospirillum merdipullorum TaxID=2838450 RepID=A0A9E2KMU3_9GAMM|nr:anaerobic glycerol-3-phosphate dehydrogenase subunit C [Candidatus Anaerobiospirillum merdipullorum]